LLLTAYKKFSENEFIKLAEYVYIFSMRYNVIAHNSPKELEKIYNSIAIKISSGELTRASHIKNQDKFKSNYISDEKFKNIFQYHLMPSRQSSKKIRFLLTQIDNFLSNQTTNYEEWTLEHILPYNPTEQWLDDYGINHQQDVDRLGNMTLLTKAENDECSTKNFDFKKNIYVNSNSSISNKMNSYPQWDSETLSRHQEWLAEQAVKTWKINYD
jgi:hypothetical protein